jgi:hypothetical protein
MGEIYDRILRAKEYEKLAHQEYVRGKIYADAATRSVEKAEERSKDLGAFFVPKKKKPKKKKS